MSRVDMHLKTVSITALSTEIRDMKRRQKRGTLQCRPPAVFPLCLAVLCSPLVFFRLGFADCFPDKSVYAFSLRGDRVLPIL